MAFFGGPSPGSIGRSEKKALAEIGAVPHKISAILGGSDQHLETTSDKAHQRLVRKKFSYDRGTGKTSNMTLALRIG